ncbi:unnamed protein product [Phytophthora fragariaefolia]|uniref:Unnamed protein product n=1 Tax=Phytophthora fragariaefolia TaxID=1490495 RepID=A0A9W6XW92_9STRA|nr:unnamed protein product [Phytophthora fragariaefolia]
MDTSEFYPVVDVSRLKAVKEFGDRPKVRLTRELTDEVRLDFDEELLPEDGWDPDSLAGEYEVESILDDRRPMETSTRRSVREFLVKWVGYDEPTWAPMTNLSCEGLLYDYLREKRNSQRFQMVQVADEDYGPARKWTAGGDVQPALQKNLLYDDCMIFVYDVNKISDMDMTK